METTRKLTCFTCRSPIDIPPGFNAAGATLRHYMREHPDVMTRVDRQQLTLQNPRAENRT